jgi:acetolactate synthase-1/2/3 large subunit
VKELIRVEATKRIPELLRRAFAVATSGTAGPVVLDVPEDVCHGEHDFDAADFWVDEGTLKAQARRTRPDPDELERAAKIIAKAERPLLLVGGGIHISEGYDALLALAEASAFRSRTRCPARARSRAPIRSPRFVRPLLADRQRSDRSLRRADRGRLQARRNPDAALQLIPPGKPLIHIDILAEEIGRTTRTDVALVSDARLALQDLAAALSDGGTARAKRQPWCAEVPARMAKWAEGAADRLKSKDTPINVGRLMGELNAIMPDDAILVADGGFAGHWGGLCFDTKRAGRHFIADRGFASIGYGLPGSMGAQLAAPKRRVVGLTGDGGFNMTLGELETARRAGTPFVLCVFNNAASGYVKALQHSMFGAGNYQSSDLVEMDYGRDHARDGLQGHPRRRSGEAVRRVARRGWRIPTARRARYRGDAPTRLKCCQASTIARSR